MNTAKNKILICDISLTWLKLVKGIREENEKEN